MVNPLIKYSLVLSLLTLLAIPNIVFADDDITIQLSLDRDKIGQEEVATLTVKVITSRQMDMPAPKLPPLPQFEVHSIGKSTQYFQKNNTIESSLIYNYALVPKRIGKFPIHSAWLVYNNNRYESNKLTLEVVSSAREASGPLGKTSVDNDGEQKEIFLVVETDKKTAYVDEQVTLIVKFYKNSRIRLLSQAGYTPPQMTDFWPIDLPRRDYNQVINGAEYNINEIRYALYATKPGKLTIGPAKVSTSLPEKTARRRSDPFVLIDDFFKHGKNVSVRSNPLTVEVLPLPMAGKGKDFSGAVGEYRLSASVDKTSVEVNEAITLTVNTTGTGNTRSIPDPTLPKLDNFRVEKSSSNFKSSTSGNQIGGTKTCEYLLIPRLPGNHTIEPLSLTYFNPTSKRYSRVETKPISLVVNQGELVAGTEIPYNPVAGQVINLQETDIRFIKTNGGALTPAGRIILTSPLFLTVVILPVLVLIGGFVDVRRRRRFEGDIAYARLRRAKSVVKKRLKKTLSFLNDSEGQFYAELSGAVYQYVGDKLNQSQYGLTSEELDTLLENKKIDEELRAEIQQVLQEADFGRFAGSGDTETARKELLERAEKAIIQLEETL